MYYLEMNHVKKSFGDLHVLNDISLQVRQGEVVSIIGPSGSGKSTLLRIATLLETMDDGELSYMDEPIVTSVNGKSVYAPHSTLKKARTNFGLVFQNFNLFPHYTVLKNIIDAPLKVQKRKKHEVLEQARKILAQMGLSDKEDYYPCQLSGGQQQRVAIARALVNNPAVILADEATGNLDTRTSFEILVLFQKLYAEGRTIIFVTHNPDIANYSSRNIELRDGRVISDKINDHVLSAAEGLAALPANTDE